MLNTQRSIGIIGSGSFGTALAVNFSKFVPYIYLKCRSTEFAEKLKREKQNEYYLKGVPLSENIMVTDDYETIFKNCHTIFLAVPSNVLQDVLLKIKTYKDKFDLYDYVFINTAKGLGDKSMDLPHKVFSRVLGDLMLERYAILSGPSFAVEVSKHLPTAVCVASSNIKILDELKNFFKNIVNFRIYTLNDVIGVELGGSLKNIIALAAGISDGLGLGSNARAALLTRGIVEITRFGEAFGADKLTFTGLSGLGDLILTSTSDLSRNRSVGLRIGRGENLESILKGMKMVAEGVATTRSAHITAKEKNIYMPITEVVYSVLYEGLRPEDAIIKLLERDIKNEFI
ncbi:MAG: NAD(P)-dependent glycerol-3-phosphate dehydrogenase [Deltaproteobacteria bacterium]|nr:NAD(P)-dependent glycerol-3-phosphate dehydrogenase [Deltaproteobacteria bacterium]